MGDQVVARHADACRSADGLLSAPMSAAVRAPVQNIVGLGEASAFASAAIGVWAAAIRRFNAAVADLNVRWQTWNAAQLVGLGALSGNERDDAQADYEAARGFLLRELQHDYAEHESDLDQQASSVAASLDSGPSEQGWNQIAQLDGLPPALPQLTLLEVPTDPDKPLPKYQIGPADAPPTSSTPTTSLTTQTLLPASVTT